MIKEKELGIVWEPARSSNLLAQQVFISDDNGNSWKYNAVANQGPMLLPQIASHTGVLSFEHALKRINMSQTHAYSCERAFRIPKFARLRLTLGSTFTHA